MTHRWAWLDDFQTQKICWNCFLSGRRHGNPEIGYYWEWRKHSRSRFGGMVPRCEA